MKTTIFKIPYTEHIIFPKNSKLRSNFFSKKNSEEKKRKKEISTSSN